MNTISIQVSVAGKTVPVRATLVNGHPVITAGGWLKTAFVHDEDWLDLDIVADPASFVASLTQSKTAADIFTFAQHVPDVTPRYGYPMEWDNVAAIPITSYDEWFEKRVEYDVRKAVRKATKAGVEVKAVEFTDELAHGIRAIYNESPIRQGRLFWHYGKDFVTVKRENSTYLERSEFIGAFYGGELIGFIRMLYVGPVAKTLQVIAMNRHFDKKPVNALIAGAVRICEEKGMSFLVYDKYSFGGKAKSSFTEFKRRNGFEEIRFPRYYVPLTVKGRLASKLGLHRGFKERLPRSVKDLLVRSKSRIVECGLIRAYFSRRYGLRR